MELKKNIFYPITSFHLMLSILLRNKLNQKINYIILDRNLFDDKIIEKVKNSNNWTLVIVLPLLPKFFTSVCSMIFSNLNIFKKKINFNVFYFSPGNNTCNITVNILEKNNQIFLCDDGVAPYYFNENILKKWSKLLIVSDSRAFLFKILFFLFQKDVLFHETKVSKIILLNKKLSRLVVNDHIKFSFNESEKLSCLSEIEFYYDFLIPSLNTNYNVVFFHSGLNDLDNKIYNNILEFHKPETVFHCFRQSSFKLGLSKKEFNNNNTVPWEIIHFTRNKNFKNALLISTNLTTAFIDTVNPFINSHDKLILSSNVNITIRDFNNTIQLVNSEINNQLYVLDSLKSYY